MVPRPRVTVPANAARCALYRPKPWPEMSARAAARNDGEPGSEDPAPIKMSNTKLGQACSEELAPTKLNEQDNTHADPVRAPGSALIAGILYMKALYISIPPSLYIAAFLLVYI